MYPFINRFSAALLLGMFFFACGKTSLTDIEVAPHDSDFAFPLFQTTLNINDMLPKLLNDTLEGDTLLFNADGTITLSYASDVATKKVTDLFSFFSVGLVPVIDTAFVFPYESPDSLKIKKALLKNGTIKLIVVNTTQEVLTGNLIIPEMTENGAVVSIPFQASPGMTFTSAPITLNGKLMTSTNNSLSFKYFAYRPNGTRIKIPDISNGVPAVALAFEGMEFSYLEGFWGREVYDLDKSTIEIDINKTELDGDFTITDPRLEVIVDNSFGFPTRGNINYVRYHCKNGQTINLQSPIISSGGIDFKFPLLSAGEVGQSKRTTFKFDKTNSNIAAIFNAQPYAIEYDIQGISNATNDPTLFGFLTDSSRIKFGMVVELNLEGSLREFGSDQTLDLDFGSYADGKIDNVDSLTFKLVTENGMPLAVANQIYFTKANGAIIDSLFTGGRTTFMQAAPVGSDGRVTEVKRTETYVPMEIERFERIKKAKKAQIVSYLTTSNGGQVPVKILSNMQTKIKMGLRVKTKFE